MLSLSSPSLPKPLSSCISRPSHPVRRTCLPVSRLPQPVKAAANMYELLSVSDTAGPEEIKAAYRRQALRWHPDACLAAGDKSYYAEQFMLAREAYEVLSDPTRRQHHDLALGYSGAGGNWAEVLTGGTRLRRSPARERGGFGDWESQLAGLGRRAARPGRKATWGSTMRSANRSKPYD